MEIEVGNEASLEDIHRKLKEIYAVLENAVQAQLISNGVQFSENHNGNNSKNISHQREDPITPSQKKLIKKLVREQEIFGKERFRLLNIKSKEEAKKEIKSLLARSV